VLGEGGIIGADLAAFECPHEHDTTARAVSLVARGEVRGAGRQAEAQ
jgi:hypothetical protein